MRLDSPWPWVLGYLMFVAVFVAYWARLKRPERRAAQQLRWGGVIQRRPLFVAGASDAEIAERVSRDCRFYAETLSRGDWR